MRRLLSAPLSFAASLSATAADGGVLVGSTAVDGGVLVDEPRRRLNGANGAPAGADERRNGTNGAGPTVPDSAVGANGAASTRNGRSPSVSVVIPAFNEEESIDWVLERLPAGVEEVVLIDGLSTDRTEAIARKLRPDIIVVHQRQRGKGAALRAGFAAARGDIIVMMDADGSTDPGELDRFVAALEAGADFVKGSRVAAGGGSIDLTPLRKAGNLGFVLLVNLLYGSRFTDLCYGYCAFWRRHLDSLALCADGFEIESELILNAVRAGLSIREVPSMELARRGGASNLRAFSDGSRVLRMILRHRFARDSRARMAGSPIELVALDHTQARANSMYLAVAPARGATVTDSPRWLSAARWATTSRNRSVAGAARTALPWALSTVLLIRQRGAAAPERPTRRSSRAGRRR
jgi:hypothetical protein